MHYQPVTKDHDQQSILIIVKQGKLERKFSRKECSYNILIIKIWLLIIRKYICISIFLKWARLQGDFGVQMEQLNKTT